MFLLQDGCTALDNTKRHDCPPVPNVIALLQAWKQRYDEENEESFKAACECRLLRVVIAALDAGKRPFNSLPLSVWAYLMSPADRAKLEAWADTPDVSSAAGPMAEQEASSLGPHFDEATEAILKELRGHQANQPIP